MIRNILPGHTQLVHLMQQKDLHSFPLTENEIVTGMEFLERFREQ